MKAVSIYQRLVRSLSFSITSVTIGILLLADVAVDSWVHGEFNRAMYNKANLLTTLVDEDAQGIEFDFAGEFMPEFERNAAPEYYQLWRDGETFERSDTLDIFATKSLDYKEVNVGEELTVDIILPDGRGGQVLYYRFLPQIDSDDREEYSAMVAETGAKQQPMLLAYAISTEELNLLMSMIDISFFIAAILVVLIIRTAVKKAVSNGLKPLEEFTEKLKSISVANKCSSITLSNQVLELMPIQESLNTFIQDNRKLYLKEQRLTSDIAHELKTPITELINLTEVSIKFPNDASLEATYKPEILNIGLRMQDIVANMLLFHRYSHEKFEKNDVFDSFQVLSRLSESNSRVEIVADSNAKPITSNLFAFERVFTNLLKNADTYSPPNSKIHINVVMPTPQTLQIAIMNQCTTELTQDDLELIFEPLWQKDTSRTSTINFGLGLSIVQTFVVGLSGRVDVYFEKNEVVFSVTLPIDS